VADEPREEHPTINTGGISVTENPARDTNRPSRRGDVLAAQTNRLYPNNIRRTEAGGLRPVMPPPPCAP
jgi:hypothetical protein